MNERSSRADLLLAALSGLLLRAETHGVRGFGRGLALLDLGLLLCTVGLLFRDAALRGGGSGQRSAVGAIVLHSIGIC